MIVAFNMHNIYHVFIDFTLSFVLASLCFVTVTDFPILRFICVLMFISTDQCCLIWRIVWPVLSTSFYPWTFLFCSLLWFSLRHVGFSSIVITRRTVKFWESLSWFDAMRAVWFMHSTLTSISSNSQASYPSNFIFMVQKAKTSERCVSAHRFY